MKLNKGKREGGKEKIQNAEDKGGDGQPRTPLVKSANKHASYASTKNCNQPHHTHKTHMYILPRNSLRNEVHVDCPRRLI